jgi:hypothetical protein
LVIGLSPLRVIQGDAPPWVQDWALWWVAGHRDELLFGRRIDVTLETPLARQAVNGLAFAS